MNLKARVDGGGWRRWARGGVRSGLAVLLSVLLPAYSAAALGVPRVNPSKPAGGADKGKAAAASRYPTAQQESPAAKIDPQVKNAFTGTRQVTYLVKLRDEADVTSVAAAARKMATPAQRELAARSAVIRSLKQTAEASQKGLLAQLDQAKQHGQVTKVEPFWITNMVAVTSNMDAMQAIAKRSDVAKILPNAKVKLIKEAQAQSGPLASKAPGAKVESTAPGTQSVEWGVQRVGAPSVWSTYGITGQGAVVAGMDTGVDWNHPALHDRWRGYDPATGATDSTYSWFDAVNGQSMPYDDHGHGTHTMGTAVGQDGANEIGVAPGARWIAVKVLDGGGSGTEDDIIAASQWLLAPGGDPSKAPDVVNNSWGGGPGIDDWLRDIVIAWRAAGIFPAFAAGNDGSADGSVSNPGNYPESFAVGATDINDALASFSGRGPSPYGVMKPQVSAPGVNVRSSVPGGGYEGGWSGTSMATPHVTGTVALLRSANAALTVDEIETILEQSADPKTDSRYTSVPNNGFGYGILNAFNAVGMVMNGVGTVNGRVVTGGDDFEPPVLTHTPVTEAFKHFAIDMTADVSDDVSVTGVYLRFRLPGMTWWGEVEMARTSGDYHAGSYAGAIPPEMTGGSAVEYYIVARDYGGNEAMSGSAAHPHVINLMSGITPGYTQDFEGATTGWMHGGTNDSWTIGEPTSGPGGAHSGTKVLATNLSGTYPSGAESYMMLPPIDLSGVANASLRFWHWYDLESNWDYGYLLASADGGQNWQVLKTYNGSRTQWTEAVTDLSAYAGNSSLLLAFYFSSDASVTKAGWYIDDVALYVDTQAPDAPANLQANLMASGSLGLTWDASTAGDLAHYTVYRSQQAGTGYASIGTAGQNAFVDGSVASGNTYYYVVTASDIYGHESGYSNEASATAPAATVVFNDDMESGAGSWTHSGAGDAWQLGAPTSGPGSAHSGSNVWATNLAGNYPNNHNASLITPPISLAGLSSASLQFAHWYSMEKDFDTGKVEISTNGGSSWTQLARYTSPDYGGTPVGWETPVIDLNAYVGQTVQIRFRLQSDGSVNFPGWYVDDVRVAGLPNSGTGISMPRSVIGEAQPSVKGKPKAMAKPQIRMPNQQGSSFKKLTGGQLETSAIGINSLPLDATVTVVESGRVVRTNPANGSFTMMMPAGTFTLRAEAYGYYPNEKRVTVQEDATTSVVIALQPIPRGTVSGHVTNLRTGEPASGVTLSLAEDARVAPVTTGADGSFSIVALEGRYTLEAHSRDFYPASATVTVTGNQTTTADLALEPFVGIPGEIAYDDGSGDNAWAFFSAGNAFAVRMSPAQPGQATLVRGARFFHWDTSWPSPGGTAFQAAVFAVNPDGSPGALLAGPVAANAVRPGWTDVDFSSSGVTVTGDFVVAWVQAADYPDTPGIAVDESTPESGRNWQMVSGSWSEAEGMGNFMIRAIVDYEVGAPTITAPADGSFTNAATVPVAGQAYPGTTVNVMVNGAAAATAAADAGGHWSASLTLTEGEYALTASATVNGGGTTRPSDPVRLVVDMTNPALNVATPADGSLQNTRVITVTGTVQDANLNGVSVNGTAATVEADGSFLVELVGREGANTVTVTANDRAGNTSTVTRTITIRSTGPVLNNVQPASNTTLYTGEHVTVAFDSEPGLALAAFSISLNGMSSVGGRIGTATLQPGEGALRETSPGHYEAQYTLPDGVSAPQAYVHVRAVDAAGNETRAVAAGVLTLVDNNRPTAVITGPTSGQRNRSLSYNGRSSTDSDGRIVSYRWEWGDGTSNSSGVSVNHTFRQAGTYTVRLTVTDDRGATASTTVTVTIR